MSLAFFLGDVLADDDHAVFLGTGMRAIAELGHLLALQSQRLEAAFADDAVLDVDGPVTQARHGLVAWRPDQLLPVIFRQFAGNVCRGCRGRRSRR